MKCFLCQGDIVYYADEFKHYVWRRTGHKVISRTSYTCLSCQNVRLSVNFPEEELYSFQISIDSGYHIWASKDEKSITISPPKSSREKDIIIPWVDTIGMKNIVEFLALIH